jgi:uncharacterized protein YcfL
MRQLVAILAVLYVCCGCQRSYKVYLCNGPQSEVYHKTNRCQGLRKCSTEIEAVDMATAKEKKRRECGYCYK